MTRYIDAEALVRVLEYEAKQSETILDDMNIVKLQRDIVRVERDRKISAIHYLKDAPTIDAVEVIRCKDCQHFQPHKGRYQTWRIVSSDGICKNHNYEAVRQNDYCSCAEREDK